MDRPAKHVLLVEDHAPTCTAFARALSQMGFVVYARMSAEEAAAREEEYKHLDMAILDVLLPGQRGDEYGVALRNRHPRLPIVFITGDTDVDRIRMTLPDAQILTKPVDVTSLLNSFIY